jgi:hypothetical protein
MKTATLTAVQEQCLREQVIDAERPGPVLHDFQVVLDFVGPEGVAAAGKYNLLPLSAIGALDERLSRPLRLPLKRPQLRSHPYLQGLHLLLRSSGLVLVEGAGTKARLVQNADVLARWEKLNSTERYFTLLEAWLRFGTAEMVGEQGRMDDEPLIGCLQAWQHLPPEGKKFDIDRPDYFFLHGLYREFYHLALMDLFGLVEVQQPPHPVQPWRAAAVRHTSFGDAMFTLLQQLVPPWFRGVFRVEEEEDAPDETAGFGAWQPLFQPYFPAWRENFVLPEIPPQEGTMIFKVSLGNVWRRITMPADASLETLASWILKSVHFDSDHLYEFSMRDRFGANVSYSHPYMDEGPYTDEITLGELTLRPGDSMRFLYDFGDEWEFNVQLESVEPPGRRKKTPRILEKHGKAPEQYPHWDD